MKAQVLYKQKSPLILEEVKEPFPKEDEIKIKVSVCGLCRTDLHIVDGDLLHPKLPLILGHQIVGYVVDKGEKVTQFNSGDRVGIPWLGEACGKCPFCLMGKENLCDFALYTGYQKDGGFAEFTVAKSDFAFPLSKDFSDIQVAPLLCAGFIGYRALRLTEGAKKIGFYGFGSSAHILIQVVNYLGGKIYAFVRDPQGKGGDFARSLKAHWVGSPNEAPPELLDAAILFAPVGEHYPMALKHIRKGGVVVSAGIHMSDIPSFSYDLLWGERSMRSVANLTRQDGRELLEIAPKIPIHTNVNRYPLENLNQALDDLRAGKFSGSAVITIS